MKMIKNQLCLPIVVWVHKLFWFDFARFIGKMHFCGVFRLLKTATLSCSDWLLNKLFHIPQSVNQQGDFANFYCNLYFNYRQLKSSEKHPKSCKLNVQSSMAKFEKSIKTQKIQTALHLFWKVSKIWKAGEFSTWLSCNLHYSRLQSPLFLLNTLYRTIFKMCYP